MDTWNGCISVNQKWVNVGLVTAAGVVAGSTGLLMCLKRDKNKNNKTKDCIDDNDSDSSVSEEYNIAPGSYTRGYNSDLVYIKDKSQCPHPRRRFRYSGGDTDQADHQLPHEEETPPNDSSNTAFNNPSTGAARKRVDVKEGEKEIRLVEPTRSNIKLIDSATAIEILKAVNTDEEPSKETMDAFYAWIGLSSAREIITCEKADVGLNIFTTWRRELSTPTKSPDHKTSLILHRCSYVYQRKLYSDKQRKQKQNSSAWTATSRKVTNAEDSKCRTYMEGAKCRTMEDVKCETDAESSKCRTNVDAEKGVTKVEGKLINMEGSKCVTKLEGDQCRMPYTVDTNPRRILRVYKKHRSEHRMKT